MLKEALQYTNMEQSKYSEATLLIGSGKRLITKNNLLCHETTTLTSFKAVTPQALTSQRVGQNDLSDIPDKIFLKYKGRARVDALKKVI